MPFEMPIIENPEKQLSKATIKNYKTYLNRLAKEGIDNINVLQEMPEEVVECIDTIMAGEEDRKFRAMYCAIFYVLADTDYKTKTKVYYNAFRAHVNSWETPDKKH